MKKAVYFFFSIKSALVVKAFILVMENYFVNHIDDVYCFCTVFEHKNMSLSILAMHQIMLQVEQSFPNLEKVEHICQTPLLNKFTFYIAARVYPPYRVDHFIMECNFQQLFIVLFSKFKVWKLEMLSERDYEE